MKPIPMEAAHGAQTAQAALHCMTHGAPGSPGAAQVSEGMRLAFFSRADDASCQVKLFATPCCAFLGSRPSRAPRFVGKIDGVPVVLFLRTPTSDDPKDSKDSKVFKAPFLSVAMDRKARPTAEHGQSASPVAHSPTSTTLGTARVVTSSSGAPRLLLHMGARRLFVSVSRSLTQEELIELGLDEQRQRSKRASSSWFGRSGRPTGPSGPSVQVVRVNAAGEPVVANRIWGVGDEKDPSKPMAVADSQRISTIS